MGSVRSPAEESAVTEIRYVAYVRGAHRSGTLTTVAEVVSARGVSIESIASGEVRDATALLTVVFTTSTRLERVIERTLGRLAVVSSVQVYRASDPAVRAAGVVEQPGLPDFVPPDDALVRWSGDSIHGRPLLIEGQFLEVEKVLDAARQIGSTGVGCVLLPPMES